MSEKRQVVVNLGRDQFDRPTCELVGAPGLLDVMPALDLLSYAVALAEAAKASVEHSAGFESRDVFFGTTVFKDF